MRATIFHILVVLACVGRGSTSRVKIINGKRVEQSSVYHAMYAMPTKSAESDDWLGCGASIISPTYALTAAHCFGGGMAPCSGPQQIALWMGNIELDTETGMVVPKGRSFRVEADLICNPDFDGKCSHGADVALLRLHRRVPYWVKPVSLDLDGAAAGNVGETVTAMGFGLIQDAEHPNWVSQANSEFLRKVSVTVLPQDAENCARVYSGGWGCSDRASEEAADNIEEQVCAAGSLRDTCAGDSGSPVVDARGVQVAVVSYGGGPGEKFAGRGRMCGDPEYPGVYARVSAFGDFIRKNVDDLPESQGFLSPTGQYSSRPVYPHYRRNTLLDDTAGDNMGEPGAMQDNIEQFSEGN